MHHTLGKLEFSLTRDVVIRAPRAVVFRFFTDSERFARWWGPGSTIEPVVGGAVRIVYPGGSRASGEVLELRADERVVFSYGYEGEGKPIAPGASRVTITLHDHAQGTELCLVHEVASAALRDQHVQGWRFQLALYANAAANDAHADAQQRIQRWFAAWNEPDEALRANTLGALCADDVLFQDAYSLTRGRGELLAHIATAKLHMPGIRLEPAGPARHCQGTALADWSAILPDGKPMARGTNVFEFSADGRVARVVGLWG